MGTKGPGVLFACGLLVPFIQKYMKPDLSLVSMDHLLSTVNQQQARHRNYVNGFIVEPRRPSSLICYSLIFLQPRLIQSYTQLAQIGM